MNTKVNVVLMLALLLAGTGANAQFPGGNGRGDHMATASGRTGDCTAGQFWTACYASEVNQWTSVTYGDGGFVAVSNDGTNRVMISPDGSNWTACSAAEANSWQSVTYGIGQYVAVSSDGTNRVMTSPDGIIWTARSAAEANSWQSVTYGNGLYLAVANDGTNRVMTSLDGITWTARSAAEANSWQSVTYGNGLYLAVASDGTNRVMTSPDGITWTSRSASEANSWRSVTYGNGLFVAVASDGSQRVMKSPNGETWTAVSPYALVSDWYSVTYGNGLFVAIASNGSNRVMTSPNGNNWTASKAAQAYSWISVAYGNKMFIAVANNGTYRVMYSTCINPFPTIQASAINFTSVTKSSFTINWTNGDGAKRVVFMKEGTDINIKPDDYTTFTSSSDWSSKGTQLGTSGYYCIYNGTGSTVSVSNLSEDNQYTVRVYEYNGNAGYEQYFTNYASNNPNSQTTISDCFPGYYWTPNVAAENNMWNSVAYGDGLFVAVSGSGTNRVMTSTDGLTWTARAVTEANTWNSVTYGTVNGVGLFVAVSTDGANRVMTSPDGITWTARTAANVNSWKSVTYGNGLFVAVANGGGTCVMTSPDGIIWTSQTVPASNTWMSVTYGNGIFVAVSWSGTNQIMTSPDGITWTAIAAPEANYWLSVTYGNSTFVAISQFGTNRVMTSPDAITWTARAVEANQWKSVTYGNDLFVAVAAYATNSIMTSPDGINWKARANSVSNDWSSITAGTGVFVAISGFGDYKVLTSYCPTLTVTTQSASAIAATNATGNGTITFIGSGNATNRGVIWYPYTGTDKIIGDTDVTNVSETSDFDIGAFTASLTGLSVDTRYNARAHATNAGDGTKYGARVDFWTLANVPSAPTVNNATATTLDVAINANSNPASTEFAIYETSTNKFVQADGTLGATTVWATATSWGTKTVSGLSSNTQYTFEVKARNGENTETAYGTTASGTTLQCYAGQFWTARTAAEANTWYSVTYGNGLFVAVSYSGTNRVMTSPDGINWTARTAAEANEWYSVTYGNGLFVAVSNSGTNRVMTSPDGINWTARTAAAANGWYSVTYGNGLFVAVSYSGTNRVMTSPDGINWTARTAAAASDWCSVSYGNGLYLAVSWTGTTRVMTSSDGITWTARTAAEANSWRSVTYGNGLFVAVARDGTNRVMTSTDGITWTARTASEANQWYSVTYGNGLYAAVAYNGTHRVMTSPDGITWTARTAAAANQWVSLTYGNGIFVAVSLGGIMTSDCTAPFITLTTQAANAITSASATGNGNITQIGSGNATNRGIIYYPYTNTDKIIGGESVTNVDENGDFGTGAFTASLNGLSVNTHYNARAHATNVGDGTKYGDRVDFWTLANVPDAPTVNNPGATTLDVAVNGNENPIGTEFAIHETSTGNFVQANGSLGASAVWQTAATWGTKQITCLSTGNEYTFEVKARSGGNTETAYGASASGTPVGAPTVTTQAVSAVAATSATGNGNVTSTGGINPTVRGMIYWLYTNTDKIIGDADVADVPENGSPDFGTGAFTRSLTGLSVNVRFNARAYAINTEGTGYGARVDFWTLANIPDAPTVNNPSSTTLDVAVNINGNPAGTEFAIHETSTGNFVQANGLLGASAVWQTATTWGTKQITGLTTGNEYTFEVKARNGGNTETAYSTSASGTPVGAPTVTTQAASTITASSATGNGNVTSTGGINPTVRGIIYWLYTNTDKIISDADVTDVPENGSPDFGTGAFTRSLMGLSVNVRYNARAYATNTEGTGYGARVDFWTLANVPDAPTVNNPSSTTLDVALNVNGNPIGTEFAIHETSTGNFVQANGSLGASAVWQTATTWGTKQITGLTTGNEYTFEVKARNGGNTETAYGATANGTAIGVPTISITSPLPKAMFYNNPVTVSGTASDPDNNLSIIEVKTTGGSWQTATGTNSWSIGLNLIPGKNTIEARAKDATNVYSDIDSVNVALSIQVINIPQGWSYISSYLNPTDPNIVNMWADIVGANHLGILTGVQGIYAPAPFYINTLGTWNVLKGYKVKMAVQDDLIVSGDSLVDKSVTFPAGVHLIPMLTNHSTALDLVFDNPATDILYMLDIYSNLVYWPGGILYTLTDLVPGKGYLANFKNPVTLTYPPMTNFTVDAGLGLPPASGPWPIVRTSNYHLISISTEAISQLQNADFIGAFDNEGNCVGYAAIEKTGQNILLTIYGDEPMTPENDGLAEGEVLRFRSYSINDNSEKELTATFIPTFPNNDGLFVANGLSGISGFKESATGVGENELADEVQVYPNPATDVVNISLKGFRTLEGFGTLISAEGRMIKTFEIQNNLTNVDVSDLQPGIYLLKIESDESIVIKRVVIQ